MEIIHPGNAPRKSYVGTCVRCRCKVRCLKGETKVSAAGLYTTRCPNGCDLVVVREEGRKGGPMPPPPPPEYPPTMGRKG